MDRSNQTGPELLQVTLQLHADLWKTLDRAAVTPLQAYVLIYVHEHQDSTVRPGDIAKVLRLKLPTISELLSAMIRKKWLTSKEHEHDRRSRALNLTNTGRAAMRRAVVALKALEARYSGNHTGSTEAIRVLADALKQ